MKFTISANDKRVDGSPIAEGEIFGFNVYSNGSKVGFEPYPANQIEVTGENLTFSTVDSNGVESSQVQALPARPYPPKVVKV